MCGSVLAIASLTAREKSRHSVTVRLGLRGTTTCSPLPPVVLTHDVKFSVVRTSRTSRAALTTCCHATFGPGSRSHTSRFGRSISSAVEFQVWISTIPICARDTTASIESAIRYSPTLVFSWIRTLRSALGPRSRVLQKIARCGEARRAMHQRQRPAGYVRNDPIGDALEVSSELYLRSSEVGVDHSVRVGDPNAGDRRG